MTKYNRFNRVLIYVACATFVWFSRAQELTPVVSYSVYSSWGIPRQALYIKDLRAILVALEKESPQDFHYASMEKWQPGWLFSLLIPMSDAADPQYCPIGGGERLMTRDANGNYLCPTSGRGCGSFADGGFTCFSIFGNACVSRFPMQTLTQRCAAAGGSLVLPKDTYEKMSQDLSTIAGHCRTLHTNDRFKDSCSRFIARLQRAGDANKNNPVVKLPAAKPESCFPDKTVKIKFDPGGSPEQYMARAHNYNQQGVGVQILGYCVSACVDMIANIPKDHICVGPRAALGFHYASSGPHDETILYNYTQSLVNTYPKELQNFWSKVKDVGRPLSVKFLRGRELQSIYASCSDLPAKCASAPSITQARYLTRQTAR